MIFQHTWPQVVTAQKTVTRRIISDSEVAIRGNCNRIMEVKHNGRVKWRVGGTYSVQPGRGHSQLARVRLTRITQQLLTRISTDEAIAEGFSSRQEFFQTWKVIHGPEMLNVRVWVLEFELVEVLPALEQLRYSSFVALPEEVRNQYAYQGFSHSRTGVPRAS